jgi:hypothetical protein
VDLEIEAITRAILKKSLYKLREEINVPTYVNTKYGAHICCLLKLAGFNFIEEIYC